MLGWCYCFCTPTTAARIMMVLWRHIRYHCSCNASAATGILLPDDTTVPPPLLLGWYHCYCDATATIAIVMPPLQLACNHPAMVLTCHRHSCWDGVTAITKQPPPLERCHCHHNHTITATAIVTPLQQVACYPRMMPPCANTDVINATGATTADGTGVAK